jgi:hypothetical protein
MKTTEKLCSTIRQHQALLADRYGVRVVGLFGSYAKRQQTRRSDLDLLVDIVHPVSLLELVGAELYLSDILGLKVDLIPKRSLRQDLREAIAKETVTI